MVNYAYLKKLKQMAIYLLPLFILLILYQTSSTRPTSGSKMATYERDRILVSKVNFPAKSAIYTTFQLFSIKM